MEACALLFSLDEVSIQKLRTELQSALSILIQLIETPARANEFNNVIFLKKIEERKLQLLLADLTQRLVRLQTKSQLFEYVHSLLMGPILKPYFDAFVTSLVILQGRE